ncbi:MAG: hypothetical protein JJE13_12130 [Thermoleophilia bacterium]|nr:hypothetical protein [Thermoleophilia bacterium]
MTGKRLPITAISSVAALACLALMGFAGTASAAPVKTKVTIDNAVPRLYGYLETAKPARCSRKRRVAVIQVGKGDLPDQKVGTGRTRKFRGTWQWSLRGKSGPGKFYARAAAKPGCRMGTSRSVKGTLRPRGDDDYCPNTSADSCLIGTHENQLSFGSGIGDLCRKFEGKSASCEGRGYNGAEAFSKYREANFHWNQADGSTFRGVAYYVNNGSYLEGSMPGPFSNRFSIRDAYGAGDPVPGRHWCTPDLPGAKPGELGGPINFDFENLPLGAAVRFWGYVTFKGPHSC